MIAIVDYGMGNIHSVQKALGLFGAKTLVTNKPGDISRGEKIVLPGVGAFDDACAELQKLGIADVLKEAIKKEKPFLGICLGMQLLFEKSEEAKRTKGLGVFKGSVKKFEQNKLLKVPHMGWNQLHQVTSECPLLKNIPNDAYVYFCHSYYPEPEDKKIVAATTDYGGDFASIVWRKNVFGMQFHPEKSQETGLKILKNFVELC